MIAAADPLERRVHVGQGEHHITSDPNVVLSTILGSCVAMCVRDPLAGVGGMAAETVVGNFPSAFWRFLGWPGEPFLTAASPSLDPAFPGSARPAAA